MKLQKINITQIAEEAGVSIATVSRALNGRNGVSEDVRRRVNALLRKHNYIGDNHLNREKKIAVVSAVKSFGSYVSELYAGIEAAATEKKIEYCIINRNENSRRKLLEDIREQQCSGVLLLLPTLFEKDLPDLAASELKVIAMDQPSALAEIGFVGNDSYKGSLEAARYLISSGHTRIGYLKYPSDTYDHILRVKGYNDALEEAGLFSMEGWYISGGETPQETCGIAKEFLKKHPEITAVMCSSDDMASAVLRAAWEIGRKIPEELSVIGFDDLPSSSLTTPALTTVRHAIRESGYLAMTELDQCLRDPFRPLPDQVLPTSLVIRESSSICSVENIQTPNIRKVK
ncbi:MAG: LacI family DNA-binding transcriptional regulator [Lentisphaeria bacterium]|nr:LacI family DNA-binding transcriptional regulator [Lentisphaeria bacterium]